MRASTNPAAFGRAHNPVVWSRTIQRSIKMTITFKAAKRVEQGTGASRRLRHAGKVPGIIYGAGKTPSGPLPA